MGQARQQERSHPMGIPALIRTGDLLHKDNGLWAEVMAEAEAEDGGLLILCDKVNR